MIYPYQALLNWTAVSFGTEDRGNILYNDEKFLTMLYERHEDRFENLSLVRMAGDQAMCSLAGMLEKCGKALIVAD